MIYNTELKQKIQIDLTNEEVAEMSKQPCCDSIDLVDKILLTFTWHDQRSLDGKFKIIQMLQKHIDIVLSTIQK